MGGWQAETGWDCGSQDRLRHRLSVCDSEELSCGGRGLEVGFGLHQGEGGREAGLKEAEEGLSGWFSEKCCPPTNAARFSLLYQTVLKMPFNQNINLNPMKSLF